MSIELRLPSGAQSPQAPPATAGKSHRSPSGGSWSQAVEDSQFGCRPYSRFCGEQSLSSLGGVRGVGPLPAGVRECSPESSSSPKTRGPVARPHTPIRSYADQRAQTLAQVSRRCRAASCGRYASDKDRPLSFEMDGRNRIPHKRGTATSSGESCACSTCPSPSLASRTPQRSRPRQAWCWLAGGSHRSAFFDSSCCRTHGRRRFARSLPRNTADGAYRRDVLPQDVCGRLTWQTVGFRNSCTYISQRKFIA
jgi:hypothetical protein